MPITCSLVAHVSVVAGIQHKSHVFLPQPTHAPPINNRELTIVMEVLPFGAWCRHFVTQVWVNIGSGNGLLPTDTKPLIQTLLSHHRSSPVAFISGLYHAKIWSYQSVNRIENSIFKITFQITQDPMNQHICVKGKGHAHNCGCMRINNGIPLRDYTWLSANRIRPKAWRPCLFHK